MTCAADRDLLLLLVLRFLVDLDAIGRRHLDAISATRR
jgi:hypothetical protein